MRLTILRDRDVSMSTRKHIARYRYKVFVESLRWNLSTTEGLEQDEFDTEAAVHILVKNDRDTLIGYARLLPTVSAYLLATHFAHLVADGRPPHSDHVWELSRYAANDVSDELGRGDRLMQTRVGKFLLLTAARYVVTQGARQMVCCTTSAVQRLAERWGVAIERLGPPKHDGANWLVAACINCNDATFDALSHETQARTSNRIPLNREFAMFPEFVR